MKHLVIQTIKMTSPHFMSIPALEVCYILQLGQRGSPLKYVQMCVGEENIQFSLCFYVDVFCIFILHSIILLDSLHYARTFHLLGFLAEAFRCKVHHFQCLTLFNLVLQFDKWIK